MTEDEALDLAMFALEMVNSPEIGQPEDLAELKAGADRALEILLATRP